METRVLANKIRKRIFLLLMVLCHASAQAQHQTRIDEIGSLNEWIATLRVSFEDSIVAPFLNKGKKISGLRRYSDGNSICLDSCPKIDSISLKRLLRVDSVKRTSKLIDVYFHVKPTPYEFQHINEYVFDNKTRVGLAFDIVKQSVVGETPFLLKVLSKAVFTFKESLDNVRIHFQNEINFFNFQIEWGSTGIVENSNMYRLLVMDYSHHDSAKFSNLDLTRPVKVKRVHPFDMFCSMIVPSSQRLTAGYDLKKVDLYDSLIKSFLENKFASLPKRSKLFLGNNSLRLESVQGLISGKSYIWENIEILIFAYVKSGTLNVDGVFDGEFVNSQGIPTRSALQAGDKIDVVYSKELKSFGFDLTDEIRKILIK